MRRFDYKQNGSDGCQWNPMLPHWRVDLGKDGDGKHWLCNVTPTNHMKHLMWNVDFDTDEEDFVPTDPEWETDDNDPLQFSSPFLRPEVVYCKYSKWAEMHRTRYHRKTVEYIDIRKTIDAFCTAQGIN